MRALCDRCRLRPPVTAIEDRPLCRECVTTYRAVCEDFRRHPLALHCRCWWCTAWRVQARVGHRPYRMAPQLLGMLRQDRKAQALLLEGEDGP